jgi:hypothetical protein
MPSSVPSTSTTAKRRIPRSISWSCTGDVCASGDTVRPPSVDQGEAGPSVTDEGRPMRISAEDRPSLDQQHHGHVVVAHG